MHLFMNRDIYLKILSFISLIYCSTSIFNCTVVNAINSSLCDVCQTGYRLTINK